MNAKTASKHIESFETRVSILRFRLLPLERNRLFDEYYAEMNLTNVENSEMLIKVNCSNHHSDAIAK